MVFRDSNAWAAYPFWFGRPLGKLYRLVVVFQRETEGFAEVPWSAGEIMEIAGAAAGESDISAIDDFTAAQQAALASAFRGADDIDVAMDAVRNINVEPTRRAEHGRIAGGFAVKCVCRGILGTEIGLYLSKSDANPGMGEGAAEELGSDGVGSQGKINH